MPIKSLSKRLTTRGHLHNLDGLRAIAILLVLITHIIQRIPGFSYVNWNMEWAAPFYNGWIGVDLFFVLSGYLIGSAVNKAIENNSFSTLNFYLRRFFRIIPAYFAVIFTILLAKEIAPHLSQSMLPAFGTKEVVANFLLVTDYISGQIGIPSWSLSIEEHFYLLLPFFLLVVRKKETRVFILLASIVFALVSRMITYRAYSIGDASAIATVQKLIYFPFHNRMDSLSVGVLIALISQISIDTKIFRTIALTIGSLLAGFVLVSGALKGGFYETTIQYTLVCLGFGGILWGALGAPSLLASRYWVPIARISYSVYLTHLLALDVICHYFTLNIWMFFPVLCACLLAAIPLYLFVEYPCHEFGKRRFNNKTKPVLVATETPAV